MIDKLKVFLIPGVLLAVVVTMGVVLLTSGGTKTLTAHFPRSVSLYEGSEVRVLGVAVGKVLTVTPSGTDVVVEMEYDEEVKIPADAKAVIVAPAIVGDRFIQLTPVYEGGKVLADSATLRTNSTSVPIELDDIYRSLNDLNVALGPNGANQSGALNDLLKSTAKNFAGQGEKFNQTLQDFGRFSQTLDDNKEELFGAARELQAFISTLAANDQTVRQFNQSMADLSEMLAGEREELAQALRNLAIAMGEVSRFVRDNRAVLGRNIRGLNRVAKMLVRQRDALDEVLTNAPVALNNLYLTYNPQAGTLDTRANQGEVFGEIQANPSAFLCSIVSQGDTSGTTCDAIRQAFPRTALGRSGGARAGDRNDLTLGGFTEGNR